MASPVLHRRDTGQVTAAATHVAATWDDGNAAPYELPPASTPYTAFAARLAVNQAAGLGYS